MKKLRWPKVTGVLLLFSAATAIVASAQTLTTIYSFCSQTGCPDGAYPLGRLVQGTDGNFYGTTWGPATVFKLTSSGTRTTLHAFTGGTDGTEPYAGVIQGRDGNFYGVTTIAGGTPSGCGTAFKVSSSGTFTPLHSFTGYPSDGCHPWLPLVQASDGNFYGMTPYGGTIGVGTVFKMTPSGSITILHNFAGGQSEGSYPFAQLIQGSDGNLWGETGSSGVHDDGTIFKITLGGTLTTVHNFAGTDGIGPAGGLVQGRDGNFYGTTLNGGANNEGSVFKMTPSGTLTTLYSFCSQPGCADGSMPYAGLVQSSDGNFYGTTFWGGADGDGEVFGITSSGLLTVLHSFTKSDGRGPYAGLIQASNGNFYGVTKEGGANCTGSDGCGTAFKLSVSYSTLTVTNSGDGVVTSTDGFVNCPGTCTHRYLDNTQVTLNATPLTGWAFSGWGGTCSGTGSCDLTITENTTVSASFYQLPVTLMVSFAGNGTVTSTDGFINCPGTCQHTYDPNTPVTLNASPASGWMFSGWTGACSGVGACNIIMTQNFALTGVFYQSGHGLQFNAAKPCRLVDTRTDHDPIQGGTYRNFEIPLLGGCNIPTTALAYSLNPTVVPHGPLGYLTIWPAGEAQPLVATLNSSDGRIKANAAIVAAGTNHSVSVYVTDTTDLVIDIDGYFTAPNSETLEFYPLTPCRVVDTRGDLNLPEGLGPPSFGTGESRRLPILSSSCFEHLPNQPLAYSLNVAVVPKPPGQSLNYLTIWPSDQAQPLVATLNNPTATVVANAAIVPAAVAIGDAGDVSVYTYNSTDVIIDTNGYFAAPGAGGYSYYPTAPCRVLDTRNHNGPPFSGTLNPAVNVPDSPCGPPTAEAYVFNATVVPRGSMGYLTLWPNSEPKPGVATLNAYDGFITSNMAIVPSINGSIDAYAYGTTWLILDLSAYFAP